MQTSIRLASVVALSLPAMALFAQTSAPLPGAPMAQPTAPMAQPGTLSPVATPGLAAPAMVWVDPDAHQYHCNGDPMYGQTPHGRAMSEADARAAGARPAGGRMCS